MTHLQIEELLKRAGWTFAQSFLATFIVFAPGILSAPNLATAKALGVSAGVASLGAALSALKTFVLTYRR